MRTMFAVILGATGVLFACERPAIAGPGFAYSWLSTERNFEQCLAAAQDLMIARQYPRSARTRFGVTGETVEESLYINCEDTRHVSLVLMRAARPVYSEIDAIVAELQERLQAAP